MQAALLQELLNRLFRVTGSGARSSVSARLTAGAMVGVIVVVGAAGVTLLAEPAERWLQEAPSSLRELRSWLVQVKTPITDMQALSDEVENLTKLERERGDEPLKVEVEGPGLIENVSGGLPRLFTYLGIVVFLTFFLLASGDRLLGKLTVCVRDRAIRRRILIIGRRIQSDISRYLATLTVINISLGLIVTGIIHLLGVPNPLL